MDIQKRDFECGRWAYLRGEWKYGGWWYYYLYAMAIKVPLGVWGLGVLAIGLRISEFAFRIRRRGHSVVGSQMSFAQGSPATDDGRQATDNPPQSEIGNCPSQIDFSRGTAGLVDELFLIAPAIVVLVLASSQTGLNCHMRYVLPAFGFLFIWISQAAKRLESRANSQNTEGRQATCERSLDPNEEFRRAARFSRVCASIRSPQFALVLALLTWFIGSSLYCYPHGLSYFNELVGGPSNGWKHLAASCTDNGQDLLYLRDWCESHPEAQPLNVVHWTRFVPLEWIGVDASRPPAGLLEAADPARVQPQAYGRLPGWYILTVNKLNERGDAYKYFRYMTPVNHIGYSMDVYYVTLEEANRVRRLLGQRELPEDWPPPEGGDDG